MGRHVTEVLEKILDSGGKCRMLQTDKGSEFVNANIRLYTSETKTSTLSWWKDLTER